MMLEFSRDVKRDLTGWDEGEHPHLAFEGVIFNVWHNNREWLVCPAHARCVIYCENLTAALAVYPPFFDDFVEWLEEEKDITPPE